MTNDQQPFDGQEPIYSYSEDDAVADGVLVHPYPERWPWLLITQGVHAACRREDRTYDQALVPLLMDCVMAYRAAEDKDLVKLEGTVAGDVWIMPNSKGGMTVMQPEEY